ncbi:hypothetical protein [Bradymonas sediminis]|uniref:Uncharacterized protein n=1 Tax=Bradymonas sediminis TaxID=1548548 RepID=A0A2Z4FQE4_9DELT|nr:hypothetical protein [Bradymonas sediminis]AWV91112.1 hypothetical protein DN745_17950 [Bradymonas sediminis]TDP75145.1 hypothetical protein DFR33_1049 [Bradymonas sediminis]
MAFLQRKIRTQGAARAGLILLAATWLAACSTEEPLPQVEVDNPPVAEETRAGTLLAEYASPRAAGVSGVRVHAQFLDVYGIHYARALEALEVWSPDYELDLDACSMHSARAVESGRNGQIRLELLDVGPITVHGPDASIRLEARRLPDLLSAFSGVIYGTEQGLGTEPLRVGYHSGARYDFSAPGQTESAGFSVAMRAPEPIHITRVGAYDAANGPRVGVSFGEDLNIQWRSSMESTGAQLDEAQALASSGEDVFLRISAGFGPDRPRLSCRVEDDGTFTLPAALIEQLVDDSNELQLSLRRVNAKNIEIDGLDSAEFVFSAVDELTLVDTQP